MKFSDFNYNFWKANTNKILIAGLLHAFYFLQQLVFSFLIFGYVVTLLPLSILFLAPVKICVFLLAKILRPDLGQFMPGQSALLAREDILKKPKLNIAVYFVVDGSVDLERLRSIFEERVIQKMRPNSNREMYPELKQYWTTFLNYTFWKQDESFDLRNHVRLYDYGEQEDVNFNSRSNLKLIKDGGNDGKGKGCDINDVRRIMAPLVEEPWREGRSPWELLLVQNFKSEVDVDVGTARRRDAGNGGKSAVLIFRIHHAMGDGYSIIKLLLRDMMLVPPKIKINFPKMSNKWERIGFNCGLPFKMPWDIAGSLLNSIDWTNCWHVNDPRKLSRKVNTSLSSAIDTSLIKKVKNRYDVGYNAVLCAVAAGASKRIMEEAGQMVPKELTCMIPIPLPGHPDGLVNYATFHCFKWGMDPTLTRAERLRTISQRMSPSKYYTAPLGLSLLGNTVLPFLPNCVLQFRELAAFTVFATSLPLPDERPHFSGLGVDVVDVFASVGPGSATVGTSMCFLSFSGKQRFTVNIDKALFPDENIFKRFGDYIEDEVKVLYETETETETKAKDE